MKLSFWLFVAAAGGFAQLLLLIADREIEAGIDRLAAVKIASHDAPDTTPGLKSVSADSPNVRDER